MGDFVTALGLVLMLEGLFCAAFPKGMRDAASMAMQLPDGALRRYGLLAAVIGLCIIYLERAV